MTRLRQQMHDAMVLRGYALRTQDAYLAAVWPLPSTIAARPRPSLASNCRPTAAPDHAEEARLLKREAGRLRLPLPVWQRAAPSRCALRHPDGQGAQTPAANPLARTGQAPARSRQHPARTHASHHHLCRRPACVGAVRPATGRHRERARAHVSESAPGQGCPGSLYAALAATAERLAPVLAGVPSAPVAVSAIETLAQHPLMR